MFTKNDILLPEFLDFKIFAPNDQLTGQNVLDTSHQFTTLVVYEALSEHPEQEQFLTNILAAAKLDISKDVFLLKATKKSAHSFVQMRSKAQFQKVLFFGLSPLVLGINLDLKLYTPLLFQDCHFLMADSLSELEPDKTKKQALWNCLQELYLK